MELVVMLHFTTKCNVFLFKLLELISSHTEIHMKLCKQVPFKNHGNKCLSVLILCTSLQNNNPIKNESPVGYFEGFSNRIIVQLVTVTG